jgi:hypothetical protein
VPEAQLVSMLVWSVAALLLMLAHVAACLVHSSPAACSVAQVPRLAWLPVALLPGTCSLLPS